MCRVVVVVVAADKLSQMYSVITDIPVSQCFAIKIFRLISECKHM